MKTEEIQEDELVKMALETEKEHSSGTTKKLRSLSDLMK